MIISMDERKEDGFMYSVIILCAGQGKRTGLSYNKIYNRIHFLKQLVHLQIMVQVKLFLE